MKTDSVEIIDYLCVIWKRKALIIIGTLACMTIAGVVSFMLPPQYKVYSVLEIGTVKRGENVVAIEHPKDTKAKIDKAFIYMVMEEMKIPERKFPEIEVENPKDTRIIEISTESEDTDKARIILKNINTLLLEDHQKLLKQIRRNLEGHIKKIGKRLEDLLAEKKRLNLTANPDNTLSMLVFSSEIQENQQYYNQLEDRLGELKDTRIVKEPGYFEIPVRPKKRLNVILAGIAGLTILILLAFFMEFLEKIKDREPEVRS